MQRPRLLTEQLQYFSLFSGIGGFELGIQRAYSNRNIRKPENTIRSSKENIQPQGNIPNPISSNGDGGRVCPCCIGFSEIDKYATQVYKAHFNHKEYGDVSTINWSDTENFDLLVGGFPCQAFSIAGKRQGFGDTRGTLFFEIARCLKEKQPRLLLLENVKGLLSHNKGQTFGVILNTLDELGYDLQWQVLNSKNFGVPQNRERVFIVGHLRGTSRPEVFPFQQTNEIYSGNYNGKITKCLDSNYHKGWLDHGQRTMIKYGTNQDQKISRSISQSLNSGHYNQPKTMDGCRIRRLTPTECERLQGFPDGWTEGISDTQRYKCLGNAVTVNVIEAIMINLLK